VVKREDEGEIDLKILHIVHRDKFTSGYVNFMKKEMQTYKHYFVISNKGFELELANEDNVVFIDGYKKRDSLKQIIAIATECDLIVATGIFESMDAFLLKFPNSILNKTYLHFWGGDFYLLRDKVSLHHVRTCLSNYKRKSLFKKCAGFIFLIDGEYDKFVDITHIKKKHYVAPMPGDPYKKINFIELQQELDQCKKNDGKIKILVGNSATKTNMHIEAFKKLKKFSMEKMEIYVPLSYGDEKYRDMVLQKGKSILGKAFHPITEYMPEAEYIYLLASMNVGIFNNNRQQAMGNISIMLGLGKKLFLRDDTSMWKRYHNKGYIIYPIDDIDSLELEKFVYFDDKDRKRNQLLYEKNGSVNKIINAWNNVFQDKLPEN
jgi:hypothetical protein